MPETMIGTAAWSIPAKSRQDFPSEGSSLARYSSIFFATEINSSFYRRHKPETWARWAESVPDRFRFSVKIPKAITHECRLENADAHLAEFARDVSNLGHKLGPLLIQLPPKLVFDAVVTRTFLAKLRQHFPGPVVIEPRHASWNEEEAAILLAEFAIDRVHADPAPIPNVGRGHILYLRLHGAPKVYYSEYDADALGSYAEMLRSHTGPAWCIFDNTASGAAILNALDLLGQLAPSQER